MSRRSLRGRWSAARLFVTRLERRDVPSQGYADLMGPVPPQPPMGDLILDLGPGGPDGPYAPTPITYTTNAAGLPQLSSSPTSKAHIFLDFDGDGSNAPYDTDGTPGTFSASEQADIVEAWRQISVYYSMFDVNVTTVFTAAAPKVWHVSSNSISGGWSYVNVFPNSVAESFNQSGDVRTRLSGIAHEVGHNFGLSHQSDFNNLGVETADYSSGYADHGPIMGVDYAQNIHEFIIGHTSSPSALQDDIAIIANDLKPYQGVGGDGFRPDDHGGDASTATDLAAVDGYFVGWGVVERLTDVDAFTLTSTGVPYSFRLTGNRPSSFDGRMELLDSGGNRVFLADSVKNDEAITADLPAGTYTVLVTSRGAYADLGAYNLVIRQLPAGWNSMDLGSTTAVGYAGRDPSTGLWSVGGSGDDIGGTADHFRFAYVPLTGDGSITARVTFVENVDSGARAGVMIRESLTSNSRHGMMAVTPSTTAFRYRTTNGGSTTNSANSGTTPRWVRVTRSGNALTGWVSPDGVNWTTEATSTLTGLANVVYVGLAVTSNTTGYFTINDAQFDNVTTSGTTGPVAPTYNGLPAPTNPTITLGTTTAMTVGWDAVGTATGYAVDRSPDNLNWTQIATTANLTYTDASQPGGFRYFYRVAAMLASTRSVPSAVVSIVSRPSAVTNFTTTSWTASQIILNWRDAQSETGYRIERSTDGTNWATRGTVGKNVPSYTDNGLAGGTSYQYRVVSFNADGDGGMTSALTESTRLSAVAGFAFTAIEANRIGLEWKPVFGATGYLIERSTDGTTYSSLSTVPTLNYVDSSVSPLGEYYYRIRALNAGSESLSTVTIFAATPTGAVVPAPWTAQDVGTVSGPGASGFSGGTFTVAASGYGSAGSNDYFRFVSQLAVGDATVTARVASQEITNSALAGVMFRESTAANSRQVWMALTPTTGFSLVTRSATGAQASATTGTAAAPPYWVRLVRSGNLFTGYVSADGVSFTSVGSTSVTMPASLLVGLAASSGVSTLVNVSTFTDVSLVQGNLAPAVFAAAPTGVTSGPVSTIDFTFSTGMDTTSFSLGDVISFIGPAGNMLGTVSGYSWPSNDVLRLNLTAQATPGAYSLNLGSQVLSGAGTPRDQDRDGFAGEPADDRFTLNFRIGVTAPDADGFVFGATAYDAGLDLNPSTSGVVTMGAISNADDAATSVDLAGNAFRYRGVNYSGTNSLYVSSNGHITLGGSDTSGANGDLTAPTLPTIAPLWDNFRTDRNTATDDLVLYQLQDTNGDSTPDRLVVSWRNVHYHSGAAATNDGVTFQAVLELNTGSRNGDVTFNYVDLAEANTGATNNAGGATVGVKGNGTTSSARLVVSQNSSANSFVATGKAVKVYTNRPPTADAGGPYAVLNSSTIGLAGSGSDPDVTGGSLTYMWDFDGDGAFGETGASAARGDETGAAPTFNAAGLSGPATPLVYLRVVDNNGATSTDSATVNIAAPPQVAQVVMGDGTAQRSTVNQLTVTFDRIVTLPVDPASAFSLTGPGGPVTFTVSTALSTPTQTVATLSFANLSDGRYDVAVLDGLVIDAIGQSLDGDGDGLAGGGFLRVGTPANGLFRLFGDGNGDGSVDLNDFIAFRTALAAGGPSIFDSDGDNNTDLNDLVAFRARLGQVV